MPLVRFFGFPDGETVSLAASQAGASDAATLSNWNGAPKVQISVTRAPSDARYAPEAVWFEAEATNFNTDPAPAASLVYDPTFHEIEYVWEFGDTGATYAAPQKVPAKFKEANSATGKLAAHVFTRPGDYTVTCTARRIVDPETMQVEEAVSTEIVSIGDPDTLWDASNTIVVAHDGDFTGAPAANWQCTQWNAPGGGGPFWGGDPANWMGVLNGAAAQDPTQDAPIRVLFKRGGDYSTSNAEGTSWSNYFGRRYSYIHYGSWGNGAKPQTQRIRALGINGGVMVWEGWDIRSDYDDVALTGTNDALAVVAGGGTTLFTGCDFSRAGSGLVVNSPNMAAPHLHVAHDCTFERLGAYGFITSYNRAADWDGLGSRDRVAMLGCRDVDTGNAPHASGLGSSNGNSQGPVRLNGNEDAIITSCDFYSRYGWTGKGTWPDGINATAEQPVMRLFSAGPIDSSNPQGRTVVTRCCGEGSEFLTVASLFQDLPPFGNLLVDQVIHVGSASMNTFATLEAGATTIRNFLGIRPNVPGGFDQDSLMYFANFPHELTLSWDETARLAEPIRLHNNTFVLLRDATLAQSAFGLIDSFVTYSDENNVTYAPLSTTLPRHEDIAPFDATELWDARYLGRLEGGDGGVLQTQFAPPDGSVSLYRPQAGSPVIGTAIGLMACSDLLGAPRTQTQSRGAIEPDQT